jgi:hypothetical protein
VKKNSNPDNLKLVIEKRGFTKFLLFISSIGWRLCISFSLIVMASPIFAQSPMLELKTCGRQLQVFEDGKMMVFQEGKETTRRLSVGRMRKLRRVLAESPCWKYSPQPSNPSADSPNNPQLRAAVMLGFDCYAPIIVSGVTPPGVQVVGAARQDTDFELRLDGYIQCGRAKKDNQNFINPHWQRFVLNVARALGAKSFLKSCQCSPKQF